MSEELKSDEVDQTPDGGSATENKTTGSEGSQSGAPPQPEHQETGTFDPTAAEEAFGLPAGTLADAKTMDEAIERVREHTDQTLAVGMRSAEGAATGGTEEKTETGKEGEKGSQEEQAQTAMEERLKRVEQQIEEERSRQEEAAKADIDRRFNQEIDSWQSDRYGTSKSRTFRQEQALQKLQDYVITQARGVVAQGKPVPSVEQLLRQVRAFDDDDYRPGAAKKKDEAPLGKPGSSKTLADSEPANIHEAVASSFR